MQDSARLGNYSLLVADLIKNLFDVTIVFAVIFCAIDFGKYDFAGIAKIGE